MRALMVAGLLTSCAEDIYNRHYAPAYKLFMSTPNTAEICRTASRPEDVFDNHYIDHPRKDAALKAINLREMQCDWSAELRYWNEVGLANRQAAAQEATSAAQPSQRPFLTGEVPSPRGPGGSTMKQCVYSNGTRRSVAAQGFCPRRCFSR